MKLIRGNKSGQGMVEYIIIVALIAIAAIAAFKFFGQTVRSQVGGMAAELAGDDTKAAAISSGRTGSLRLFCFI